MGRVYGKELPKTDIENTMDKQALKKEISTILQSAISGSDQDYRTGDGFIRWGLVETDINAEIDKFDSTADALDSMLNNFKPIEGKQ